MSESRWVACGMLGFLALSWMLPARAQEITGEMKLWHRVSLTFDGPELDEDGAVNPFTHYRLDVLFTHSESGKSYLIPGFFAADGDAGETSASSGKKWRAYFAPDEPGTWQYEASFRTGDWVSVQDDVHAGSATWFNGVSGSFSINTFDKNGLDLRGRGMLRYVNRHYYQFAGDGTYFLKTGANNPENLLAYEDFDGTYDIDCSSSSKDDFLHAYEPHVADWKAGDPTWKNGKGKGLIGGLNYLGSRGVNALYFLTYNIDGGDGCDVWPWTSHAVKDRFDVSKLDQWEVVFSHMDTQGILLHVILTERQNSNDIEPAGWNGSALNDVRKLYHRELIARFGHHLALQWNLGEENTNSKNDRSLLAAHIRSLDAYQHPITVHTSDSKYDTFYDTHFGDPNFEATSLQAPGELYNELAASFRAESAGAGRPWVIYGDEQSPNAGAERRDLLRKGPLWGMLMGGGAGVEWYASNDLGMEDWRKLEVLWDDMRIARAFFEDYLPFEQMEPANELTPQNDDYVFAKPSHTYAIYLPEGGSPSIDLAGIGGSFDVRWYNPREGDGLQIGTKSSISGGGTKSIGLPPSETHQDWVALLLGGDDEVPTVSVAASSQSLSEGDEHFVVTFTRNGDVLGDLEVTYTLSGEATEGSDFESIPTTITIPDGETAAELVIILIDDAQEEVVEDIELVVTTSSDYLTDPVSSSITVSIHDNDGVIEEGVLFRVNAGGGNVIDTPLTWIRDTKNKPSSFTDVVGDDNKTGKGAFAGENNTGVPDAVFSRNRWDPEGGNDMKWAFPVTKGSSYAVYLFFAEISGKVDEAGERVFNVYAEGTLAIEALDVYGEVGAQTALVKSFVVDVEDGVLNLAFEPVEGNPFVSGIEVVGGSGAFLVVQDASTLTGSEQFDIPEKTTPSAFTIQGNYPNPFSDHTTITMDVPEDGMLNLEVFDVTGRQVASVGDVYLDAGFNRVIPIEAKRWPAGAYMARASLRTASSASISTKMLIVVK